MSRQFLYFHFFKVHYIFYPSQYIPLFLYYYLRLENASLPRTLYFST